MPLIYENQTNSPGAHALVVGVSHYPHINDGESPTPFGQQFDLEQLTCAASSAAEFASWLLNEYHNPDLPLLSLRVAMSPVNGETLPTDIQALLPTDYAATRQQVQNDFVGFRDACAQDTSNIAFVYIAGHGVQLSKHGAIVLLHDFAAQGQVTELYGAIDVASMHAGMNHPNTAQTQFWFSDACRQVPSVAKKFETLTGALIQSERNGLANVSPLFLAAITGTQAYGVTGGLSLFCQALMWALREGGAAEGPGGMKPLWQVSVAGLIKHLPEYVKALAQQFGTTQEIDPAGRINNGVMHFYPSTPKSKLTVIYDSGRGNSLVDLIKDANNPVITGSADCPLNQEVDAGMYLIKISTPSKPLFQDILNVMPPVFSKEYT